ncbi:probable glycosyltransferase At5g03795 [Actinidia eriantha]|uniref:probable glycosyltransferase At5g03795 n=1 Tax=Actinidia eriantha TaxID=165200 RepID=UPI00258ED396|nr:probable glycosyltransferase At5g03795 [Actinidia eriantha]
MDRMVLCCLLRRRRRRPQQQGLGCCGLPRLLALPVLLLLSVLVLLTVLLLRIEPQQTALGIEQELTATWRQRTSRSNSTKTAALAPATGQASDATDNLPKSGHDLSGPYQNWRLFATDYQEMLQTLKIYVYPDVSTKESSYAGVFLPHPNPINSKLGNYFSEHAFKTALIRSSLVTTHPEEAHLFFMPFSINAMRNDPRLHSEASISDFVAQYTARISSESKFWNASGGSDHFYVYCHSVGREAASKHHGLHNNAIQVTCSSSYFQRLYISHKDVGLPQVWPRPREQILNPPDARNRLVFFTGRMQNSRIREKLLSSWGNDTFMDIFSGNLSFQYEEGFRRSRYCLHVKGYEVNTARISDAIHYGCIPVIISNYYDLPFSNVLDWSKFSIIISQEDIGFLKKILLSVSRHMYLTLYHNLCLVRRHFTWHTPARSYDAFYMTAYQLWLRRGLHRLSY